MVQTYFFDRQKIFLPKILIFSTSSTGNLLSFDMHAPQACMTKILPALLYMASQSIPISFHKCEEENIRLEGKYSFLSFLMHTHTIYSFLSLCTCTRFILTWKAHTENRSITLYPQGLKKFGFNIFWMLAVNEKLKITIVYVKLYMWI